ncbi:hypothetical protein [Bradyrhizobium sp. Leo170]|uniref:hypothetical protein n=1 Tax=Bradyrhizobium sp. Leo170 TaxID=1571199 RepID=UPI00102E7986|nr:hypothetical protein [Bradyrhizobium sp. Leo170]
MQLDTRYHAYRTVPLPADDVGELPFKGARSQNIENNPMQSCRRPLALEWQLDTSGKSAAFLHHPAIL